LKDPDLASVLYKHQRQALHFMMERERPPDYTDMKTSLWTKISSDSYKHTLTGESLKRPPKLCLGGILADDMGLGKTLEVISLILKNRVSEPLIRPLEDKKESKHASQNDPFGFVPTSHAPQIPKRPNGGDTPSKATLIVCPLSTVSNWEDQFQTHVKNGALKILLFHGPGRTQNPKKLAKYVWFFWKC
jgi:SNF2 family DNA or RNA helicase